MTEHALIFLSYTLTFESAFHCGSGLSNGLIDRSIVRAQDDYAYVPGSTIKGVVRESCEQIARLYALKVRDPHDEAAAVEAIADGPDIVERLFGSRCRESDLFFDNAAMDDEWQRFFRSPDDRPGNPPRYLHLQSAPRTQTRISRRTGTVEAKALYTSEFGMPALQFQGAIHGMIEGIPNDLSKLPGPFPLFLLVAGVYATQRIGANRSTGMGRCRFGIDSFKVGRNTIDPAAYCREIDSLEVYEEAKEENICSPS